MSDQSQDLNMNTGKHDKSPKAKSKQRKTLIIAFIAILLIINGVKFYLDAKKNRELKAQIEKKDIELGETYVKLDSIGKELAIRIETIEKLGGDIQELNKIKEELETEKDQLKKNQELAETRYREIKDKLEGYRELLQNQDKEIAKLKEVNELLLAENQDLKQEKIVLNQSLAEVKEEKTVLAEKVAVASKLKAENIRIKAVNKRGKERDDLKNKFIEKLKISFEITENEVAPIQGKDIMIQIKDAVGNVLFDVDKGSGTFLFQGKEEFYTAKQNILFDKQGQDMEFLYTKGSKYERGDYTLYIYDTKEIIGKQSFTIR